MQLPAFSGEQGGIDGLPGERMAENEAVDRFFRNSCAAISSLSRASSSVSSLPASAQQIELKRRPATAASVSTWRQLR
ncbi:MAG: hypothetical protein R2851_15545 [Caldilineaceae bacterium]